uniref:Uncharacterized protein AlNc14C158G7692 n=1 Tax=Albugo laibachii Nc14 TaxID=890382 RepID=F0WMK2_9STRA|nr:conserved hypothetical protein [Albugo laibachii Nc14]|eukprot:CCA22534.1 conserved hypothetical protein [Albugo laibachii Nc14]
MALPDGTVNWPLLFGCILTAYGPIATLFFILIGKRAQLIIIALTSAFIWLISVLISATIWQIIPVLKSSAEATICVTILIQEIGRYTYFQLYSRGVVAIQKVTTTKHQLPLNDFTSSLASGVGYSLMHSLMVYGTVLGSSTGFRGAAFRDYCTLPVVFTGAITSLALSISDVALMVMAFAGYRSRNWSIICMVLVLHLGIGLSALANFKSNGCVISIPIHYGGAVLACVGAKFFAGRSRSYGRSY